MIIRAIHPAAVPLLSQRTDAPDDVVGTFGRIEILQLTSTELRESFGISLAELDVHTPFELAAALARHKDQATAVRVRNDRLVRLIERRTAMLPCFVGYQDVPGAGLLPFMSDGPRGHWSLFFEKDERMTLVECESGVLVVTPDSELGGAVAAPAAAGGKVRSILFGKLGSARRILVRSGADAH